MRLGLLADIHGNPLALDAVLADAEATGGAVDEWLVLGDLVALGYDPAGVLERLTELPRARFLRGNTDRYVLTGDRPAPTAAAVAADPTLLGSYGAVHTSFGWTAGYVAATGWTEWLAALPATFRVDLPGGLRLLAVHANLESDEGRGIANRHSDDDLAVLFGAADADIVVGGHTHDATDRTAGAVRTVNPGSVSNPLDGDPRARWAWVDVDGDGCLTVTHRRVAYDVDAVVAAIRRSGHPSGEWLTSHFVSAPA